MMSLRKSIIFGSLIGLIIGHLFMKDEEQDTFNKRKVKKILKILLRKSIFMSRDLVHMFKR